MKGLAEAGPWTKKKKAGGRRDEIEKKTLEQAVKFDQRDSGPGHF